MKIPIPAPMDVAIEVRHVGKLGALNVRGAYLDPTTRTIVIGVDFPGVPVEDEPTPGSVPSRPRLIRRLLGADLLEARGGTAQGEMRRVN